MLNLYIHKWDITEISIKEGMAYHCLRGSFKIYMRKNITKYAEINSYECHITVEENLARNKNGGWGYILKTEWMYFEEVSTQSSEGSEATNLYIESSGESRSRHWLVLKVRRRFKKRWRKSFLGSDMVYLMCSPERVSVKLYYVALLNLLTLKLKWKSW